MDTTRTIPEMLARAASEWGARPAIVEGERTTTFAELQQAARGVARWLLELGLQRGERFAIWGSNSTEWQIAALAGQLCGGVLVPINTRFRGNEAADIVRRSGSRILFVTAPFLGTDYEAMLADENLPNLAYRIRLDALEQRADDGAVDTRLAQLSADCLCDILYTSGTTGRPKGVMTTHGQNVAVFETWANGVTLNANDRYLIVNPYFHAFGYKSGWLAALITGATIYPMPVFDVAAVLEMIERERISFLPGAPTIFQSLLADDGRATRDTSSLRCAVTGAASVPVQLVKDMKGVLGFSEVYTAYGLTESTGVVSLCQSGDDFETIATTSGRAMPGVEVQITTAEGAVQSAGEPGEIWVRGFNVMQGYLDDPVATAETITPEGWLRTGDIGVMDERGYLKITDRLKDMYICGGFNCYPAEIEHRLLEHPEVRDVAVKGVPDERMGEVGAAFIVQHGHGVRDPAAIIAWARERMANYKAPRQVYWVDELPRNASGKVQKFLLSGESP